MDPDTLPPLGIGTWRLGEAPSRAAQEIEAIQGRVAELLSTVPYLQGAQVAVAGADVEGVILDASFKLRFAPLTK